MLILKNIHIKQENGCDIDVDTYFIDTDRTKNNDRLMIFAHGFKGFKNWEVFLIC